MERNTERANGMVQMVAAIKVVIISNKGEFVEGRK